MAFASQSTRTRDRVPPGVSYPLPLLLVAEGHPEHRSTWAALREPSSLASHVWPTRPLSQPRHWWSAMPVRLRLQRFGRHNRPFYRIVAADSRSPRDGKFIEIVSL